MVISMDPIGAEGVFDRYDPHTGCVHLAPNESVSENDPNPAIAAQPNPTIFIHQCRSCGHEPVPPPASDNHPCPKCGHRAWERFVKPGSLLATALRRNPMTV